MNKIKKFALILFVFLTTILITAWATKLSSRNQSTGKSKIVNSLLLQENSYRKEDILAALENQRYKYSLPGNPQRIVLFVRYAKTPWNSVPAGIAVIDVTDQKNPFIFWEQQKDFGVLPGDGYIKDITGDGRPELLSWWAGTRAIDDILWVFTFDGKKFVPLEILGGGAKESNQLISFENKVVDVDNDSVYEITGLYPDNGAVSVPQSLKKIFKFNGTEYYLWKETVEKKTYERMNK